MQLLWTLVVISTQTITSICFWLHWTRVVIRTKQCKYTKILVKLRFNYLYSCHICITHIESLFCFCGILCMCFMHSVQVYMELIHFHFRASLTLLKDASFLLIFRKGTAAWLDLMGKPNLKCLLSSLQRLDCCGAWPLRTRRCRYITIIFEYLKL